MKQRKWLFTLNIPFWEDAYSFTADDIEKNLLPGNRNINQETKLYEYLRKRKKVYGREWSLETYIGT